MDVEMQTPDGDTKIRNKKRKGACWFGWMVFFISFAITVCVGVPTEYYRVNAQYYVATDSVSSLDPRMGLSFNLTLRVASRSYRSKACINPPMYVEVFYHDIRITASEAQTQRTCARPRNVAELPVVASAAGLPVGEVLGNLSAEMREGVAVFDFVLHVPVRSYGGESGIALWVTDCKGSRIGGAVDVVRFP